MANIGGNVTGTIQTKTATDKNAIGEVISTWADSFSLVGWLGYQSGNSSRNNYMAKVEETTHVFLCDYNAGVYALADKIPDVRMILKGFVYEVLHIDNPDELDEQLEIYLKRVGAFNG